MSSQLAKGRSKVRVFFHQPVVKVRIEWRLLSLVDVFSYITPNPCYKSPRNILHLLVTCSNREPQFEKLSADWH